MKNQSARLIYLLVSWSLVGIFYKGSAYLQGDPTVLSPSIIDEFIPFSPHGIWFYLSFFIIIPVCFFYAPYSRVRWMSLCFMVIALLVGSFYLLFPTTMIFPIDSGTSISSWLLTQLIKVDVAKNCFPSLHVALTIISIWGCLNIQRPIRSVLLILWGVCICFSIIQLRRHVFIDFIGGTALALVVGYAINCLLNYFIRNRLLNARESLS